MEAPIYDSDAWNRLLARVEQLEITVAHHEQMHQAAEKTMVEQFTQMQTLERKFSLLTRLLQTLNQDELKPLAEEQPPPHY
ncbi:MAG: SlyX family protein [Thiotrichales bacterium]|nr:SlyX family protein [Thiotrichales bacterium]